MKTWRTRRNHRCRLREGAEVGRSMLRPYEDKNGSRLEAGRYETPGSSPAPRKAAAIFGAAPAYRRQAKARRYMKT